MKLKQFRKIVMFFLLSIGLLGMVSCKCSGEKNAENTNAETTDVTSSDSLGGYDNTVETPAEDGDASNVRKDNGNGNNSATDADPSATQDTVKTVPSGGSTSKKARFSPSGNN